MPKDPRSVVYVGVWFNAESRRTGRSVSGLRCGGTLARNHHQYVQPNTIADVRGEYSTSPALVKEKLSAPVQFSRILAGTTMILCAFCRFRLGDSPAIRRRQRMSKSGNVYCSHACRSLWMEQEAIKRRQQ